ncbi:predicted protein [Thalassiosira pseudonana CCMP1335]|uniref:Uncharacterized protein n=1 Tax=Thalassiosira pseudonana TaxID=35128 RepID=B8LDI0_THAPS|nr:predicted protein [Thalassiosira pseudonana CCMP1335]EED86814.1 predicted protein [Thalassiosira pseudonana CCMP1335]
MQFVDFDQQRLFGNESFTPIIGQELQFTLKNAIKKRAFLTKLREIHQHQKIVERVQALELAFRNEGKTTALEQCYNRVDYEIRCSMLAAANARARKSFRYQWSPALVTAVPQEGWYYSTSLDELYEFDNGIFWAHTRVDDGHFAPHAVSKVLPADATVAEIIRENDGIRMSQPSSTMPPTWRKITNVEEMEQWLLRRNKRHLQQMYLEESPQRYPPLW